jgi:hypothetical protein
MTDEAVKKMAYRVAADCIKYTLKQETDPRVKAAVWKIEAALRAAGDVPMTEPASD